MKYLTYIILLIILTNVSSCDPSDNRLRLYNQTKYKYEYSVIMDCNIDNINYYFDSNFLRPFDSTVYSSRSRWELKFKDSKTNQVTVLLMYDDSTNYYRMRYDSVYKFLRLKQNYKIRKFTQKQLDSCNWKITVTDDSTWSPKNY